MGERFHLDRSTKLVASVMVGGSAYCVPGPGPRANGVLQLCDVTTGSRTRDADGHVLRGTSPSSSADGARVAFVFYCVKSRTGQGLWEGAEKLMPFNVNDLQLTTVKKGGYPLTSKATRSSTRSSRPTAP